MLVRRDVMTSQKPISLMAGLAVHPDLWPVGLRVCVSNEVCAHSLRGHQT